MRDLKAKESSSEFECGTMEGLGYTLTLASATKNRCYELVELYMDQKHISNKKVYQKDTPYLIIRILKILSCDYFYAIFINK